MWVLLIELRSSSLAPSLLPHGTILFAQQMYLYVLPVFCLNINLYHMCGAHRDQKRPSDSLGLELEAALKTHRVCSGNRTRVLCKDSHCLVTAEPSL